jgi:hypothetical protein
MRVADGGELILLKVSLELKLGNLVVHYPWGVNPLANHGTHQCVPWVAILWDMESGLG